MTTETKKKRKEELLEKLTPERIKIQPFYYELKNKLVEPEKVVVFSKYFLKKWAPLLGPTLSMLVITLRQHCYYNKLAREKRDWCYPKQETLAKEIGVSKRTIVRELKKPLASKFIQIKPRSVYDSKKGTTVRTSSLYKVAMDDPLVPEDEERLARMAAEYITEQEEKMQQEGHHPNQLQEKSVKCQIDTLHSGDKLSHRSNTSKSTKTNVNVRDLKNENKNEFLETLAQDLAKELNDYKSFNFYKKIVTKLPKEIIDRTLAETKELDQLGRIKKSKGACFTDILKRLAKEQEINLGKEKNRPVSPKEARERISQIKEMISKEKIK